MVVFSPIIVQDTKKIYGYNFIAPLKVLKARKKKLALTSFYYVSWEIWLGNSKKLICIDQSRFSHTHENSKIFNITSKYFSFFNNKPPARWVVLMTMDFLICYSCSHYSSSFLVQPPLFYQPLLFYGKILNPASPFFWNTSKTQPSPFYKRVFLKVYARLRPPPPFCLLTPWYIYCGKNAFGVAFTFQYVSQGITNGGV